MEYYRNEDLAAPTILDRLLRPLQGSQIGALSRDSLEDSILRNLEMVLNTQHEADFIPPQFEECATSVLNYGLPAFARFIDLNSPAEQSRICRSIEEAVRAFEPRLSRVTVRTVDAKDRHACLRIRLGGAIEPVSGRQWFDITLDRNKGTMSILSGASR